MSYPFVGYYTCNDNEENMDQLYLYVNGMCVGGCVELVWVFWFFLDTKHLSVEDSHKIVVVYRNTEAILPCRPTSPDVNVTLVDQGHDEVSYHKRSSAKAFNVV